MMDWFLPLIGGLGLGSLLKGIVDYFLATKSKANDRLYNEKRETYLGLLNAMHESEIHPSPENAKAYGNWHNRCKLFGSHGVIEASQRYIDTSADVQSDARKKAFEELFLEMRKDMAR
ncbi:MAG: hypothetical protein WC521_02635 [Bdellovibrionales bacterium]|jgi:hypothetical protein